MRSGFIDGSSGNLDLFGANGYVWSDWSLSSDVYACNLGFHGGGVDSSNNGWRRDAIRLRCLAN